MLQFLNRQFSYTPYERLHIAAETGDRPPVGAIYRTFFADIPIVVYFFTFYLTYIKSDESGRRNSAQCVAPFTLINEDTVRHSKLPHLHAKLFFDALKAYRQPAFSSRNSCTVVVGTY